MYKFFNGFFCLRRWRWNCFDDLFQHIKITCTHFLMENISFNFGFYRRTYLFIFIVAATIWFHSSIISKIAISRANSVRFFFTICCFIPIYFSSSLAIIHSANRIRTKFLFLHHHSSLFAEYVYLSLTLIGYSVHI